MRIRYTCKVQMQGKLIIKMQSRHMLLFKLCIANFYNFITNFIICILLKAPWIKWLCKNFSLYFHYCETKLENVTGIFVIETKAEDRKRVPNGCIF